MSTTFVHTFLLSKLWHMVDVLPIPKNVTRTVTMEMLWLLWQGEVFRVLVSTLQRQVQGGGTGLIHIAAKSLTLFPVPAWRQYSGNGVTYGQPVCGLDGVCGDGKPAHLAGYSS